MSMPVLTLLFDGKCPLCAAEMARLRAWDANGRLAFIDIAAPDFDARALGLEMAALDRELHSIRDDGMVLIGIDSMLAAYTLVGKAWLVWPLRMRWLRPMLSRWYRGFARRRYRLSRWLGYRPACEDGVCRAGGPYLGV